MILTLDQLRQIMRDCAGEDELVDLDGDIADVSFDDLGYDSLARLETASRVERRFNITLPEEEMGDINSPSDFLAFVNARLAAA
jgi:minimal PKS acyl carrier protein